MTTTTAPKLSTQEMASLYTRADAAGKAAAEAIRPTPMHVVQRGAGGEIVKRYAPVMDGVCGFGWVTVRPGGSRFARWLKANTHASPGYGGGMQLWVRGYGQSYERKLAYAQGFAKVLNEAGIDAWGSGRLD